MLRVTTLYASSAAATAQYYTRYLTGATGEDPGVWTGTQAAALGLEGDVTTEQLQALLEGRDPVSGGLLGRPLLDRVSSSGVVSRAVAGFDATLSAPKSLSVWWALSGDDGLAECHDVAVRAVVDCVERYGSTTRIRADGRRLHADTGGLTVAVFRQTTSRLDDPQLHSHVVISSKVQCDDGRWWALDARTLKGYQRALGGLYQSVLRAELTNRYGVVFGGIVNGQAEIAGVPSDVLELFSKRTAQVDAAYQEALAEFWTREGRDPTPKERGALGRQAALDTRSHKSGSDPTALRERWRVEAAGIGVSADLLADSIAESAAFELSLPAMTVDQIISGLGEERSAWHRFDVLRAVCDNTRPVSGVDGTGWAQHLDRTVDEVLAECVDLDPSTTTKRRGSDGRSVWIEPSARHHTSHEVLAQEEHIVSWAIDAQHLEPSLADVTAPRLDVLQLEAASAVAGADRLVLIVGPAGTGKTTMLAAAVTNLQAQGRPVFGLAPTAKAARVLGTETGMGADTVAKLTYEWTRPDRPAGPAWRLPVGATVIVDEAGMLATGDLYRLTQLADVCRWRLVLVGDPHQLQAVGRGSMFTELVTTGRSVELATIHRFSEPWEAATSLQLRHGDPRCLDRYHLNDRIHPAPLAEHLAAIANTWLDHHTHGSRLAVTAGSNDQVATINQHIQTARRDAGQLGESIEIPSGRLHVGDVITTRANRRDLSTSTGDMVRNRDYWTIIHITPTGGLSVTRIDGHGTVTLPNTYVGEHVQLGYAATEPGNQSDTTTASITLATSATTCRGLYVGMTRGQERNDVCVVTDTHNPQDALDVLHQVLATDRVDLPAIRTRRELAQQSPPGPRLRPRCQIPDWFSDVESEARQRAVDARHQLRQLGEADRVDTERVAQIDRRLAALAPLCAPHDDAIAAASQQLDQARNELHQARTAYASAGRLHRRTARRDHQRATTRVDNAQTELHRARNNPAPSIDERDQLHGELGQLRRNANYRRHDRQRTQHHLDQADGDLAAVRTWRDWAQGHPVEADTLAWAAEHLDTGARPQALLAEPLHAWLHQHHGITPPTRHVAISEPRPSRGIEIGL